MKLKICTLILAAAMLLSCLAGCGASHEDPPPTIDAPEQTETSDTAPDAAAETDADDAEISTDDKYTRAQNMFDKDAVVMTINDEEITWQDYFYWNYNIALQMEQYGGVEDWHANLDQDLTYQDYAQLYAENMLIQYTVISQAAEQLELTLTEEEQESLDAIYQEDVLNYAGGDEAAFAEYLDYLHVPMDTYWKMNTVSVYYYKIFQHYFGENGSKLSDEDVLDYAESAGYMHASHILFLTQNDDGTSLPDEEAAAKKAAAEQALATLQACPAEELRQTFADMANELSEDPGQAYYVDGLYFTPGQMVPEFENAVAALNDLQISDIVESTYGYHIIQRLPLALDAPMDYNGYSLRFLAASAVFETMTDEWFNDALVEYTDDFSNLDYNVLFADAE